MSWIAVGVIGGAAINYLGTQSTNAANARASRGAGEVNVTTTRNPMDGTRDYRAGAAEAAYQALLNGGSAPAAAPAPTEGRPAARAVGGGAPAAPARGQGAVVVQNGAPGVMGQGGRFQPLGANAAAAWRAAGSPTGGGAATPAASAGPDLNNTSAPGGGRFQGISQYTQDAQNTLRDLPGQEAGMYGAAEGYVTDTLGGNSRNPLLGRATDAADAIDDDPELAAYMAALRGDVGGGGGRSSAPAYRADASRVWGASAPGSTASATGAGRTGVQAALRQMIAGQDAPGLAAQAAAISRQVNEGRADNIRQLRARAVGSGFYGGSIYNELETGAVAQGDRQMADSLAAARFGAYQNALGLGTQYDLGMADIDARDRASSSAGAASAANAAAQNRLAELGMWGDAIRTGQQGRAGSASALGNLSGQYSADQQGALQGVNALGASRRADLTAAGDLSLGSDQARTSYGVGIAGANASRAVGMANVNLGQQELAFRRDQFNDPLSRISAFSNALNGLTGAYGTETTQGSDRRSMSPAPYQNPYGSALQGAAIGGQVASAYNNRGGG